LGTRNEKSQKVLFTLITINGVLLFTELVCAIVLETAHPELSQIRKILKGDVPAGASFQRAIGQSYLNYVPAPGYTDGGAAQRTKDTGETQSHSSGFPA
jgi:hypothetical protein